MDDQSFFTSLLHQSKTHRAAGNHIVRAIRQGLYVALIGPRFSGKTDLLAYALRLLQDVGYASVNIDLAQYHACSSLNELFARLSQSIRSAFAGASLQQPAPAELSADEFIQSLDEIAAQRDRSCIIAFDTLEGLPSSYIHPLLITLRNLYNLQQARPTRLLVVLVSSLDLAGITLGPTSPFNIAEPVFLSEINVDDSEQIVRYEFERYDLGISPKALQCLCEAGQGDAYLLHTLCQDAIHALHAQGEYELNITRARRIVDHFVREEAAQFRPLEEPIKQIQGDCHLLDAFLQIMKKGSVPLRELPIELTPSMDAVYITGLVTRTLEDHYTLRNDVYRRVLAQVFTPVDAARCLEAKECWDKALDHLIENRQAAGHSFHTTLLKISLGAMEAASGWEQARHYLFISLRHGFNIHRGWLWLSAEKGELEFRGCFGLPEGDPSASTHPTLATPEVRALADHSAYRFLDEKNAMMVRTVPLNYAGQTVGVLRIEEPVGAYTLQQGGSEEELMHHLANALESLRRFLALTPQAHDAGNPVPVDKAQVQVLAEVINILPSIDIERALHLILTVITAHFGLSYNRAWLFQVDSGKNSFCGRMGIGAFSYNENVAIWRKIERFAFSDYKERLVRGGEIDWAPVNAETRKLVIPRDPGGGDLFSHVAVNPRRALAHPSSEHPLPESFERLFDPQSADVFPLVSSGKCIGLIVVDNFRQNPPPDPSVVEQLAVYANLAASVLALEINRAEESQKASFENILRNITFELSQRLNRKEIMARVLGQMKSLLPFKTASIQLYNPQKDALEIAECDGFERREEVLRLVFPCSEDYPNVAAFNACSNMRIPDIQQRYPHFRDPKYQTQDVRGWMCVPMQVESGESPQRKKVMGVITFDHVQADIYTPNDLERARIIANITATALEHADRYEQLKTLYQGLDSFYDIMEKVEPLGGGGQRPSLDVLAELACKGARADSAVIYLAQPSLESAQAYNCAARYGLRDSNNFDPLVDHFHDSQNLAGWHWEGDQLFVPDVTLPHAAPPEGSFLAREGVASFAGFRLRIGSQRAILYLYFCQQHIFDAEEQDLVRRFVKSAAMTLLTTDRLYDQIQELEEQSAQNRVLSNLARSGTLQPDFKHKARQKTAALDQNLNALRSFLLHCQGKVDQEMIDLAGDGLEHIKSMVDNLRQVEIHGANSNQMILVDAQVQQVIALYRERYPGIDIIFAGGCADDYLSIDPYHLGVILGNLLENSLEKMKVCGGQVYITTRGCERQVLINIRDQGQAMSAEVWEQYLVQTIDTPGSEEGRGNGGLMAHGFAIIAGGSIEKIANVAGRVELEIHLPLHSRRL